MTSESGKRIALGYDDAKWGGDLDTLSSTTGYVFRSYGGIMAWKSCSQPTVALSTTEAEYMADATRQTIWLGRLLDDSQLGLVSEPLPILIDNMGTNALSKNPVRHKQTKHIGMQNHFIPEKIEDNSVSLNDVISAENLADMLTKGLPVDTFQRLRHLMGLTSRLDQVGVLNHRLS